MQIYAIPRRRVFLYTLSLARPHDIRFFFLFIFFLTNANFTLIIKKNSTNFANKRRARVFPLVLYYFSIDKPLQFLISKSSALQESKREKKNLFHAVQKASHASVIRLCILIGNQYRANVELRYYIALSHYRCVLYWAQIVSVTKHVCDDDDDGWPRDIFCRSKLPALACCCWPPSGNRNIICVRRSAQRADVICKLLLLLREEMERINSARCIALNSYMRHLPRKAVKRWLVVVLYAR